MSESSANMPNLFEGAVVKAVVACVSDVVDGDWGDRDWVHLFVDFEIDQSGERTSSISFALGNSPSSPVEKLSFRLSGEAKRQFAALAERMGASPNGRWTSAQLRISPDGNYALTYSYDTPHRLSGNLIDNRFRDYLAQWMVSEGATAAQPPKSSF